jgi:shikimate kinase
MAARNPASIDKWPLVGRPVSSSASAVPSAIASATAGAVPNASVDCTPGSSSPSAIAPPEQVVQLEGVAQCLVGRPPADGHAGRSPVTPQVPASLSINAKYRPWFPPLEPSRIRARRRRTRFGAVATMIRPGFNWVLVDILVTPDASYSTHRFQPRDAHDTIRLEGALGQRTPAPVRANVGAFLWRFVNGMCERIHRKAGKNLISTLPMVHSFERGHQTMHCESAMIAIAEGKTRFSSRACKMRIFLAGVACVGKTTVGARLADLLGCLFLDLDLEVERFYETSIERLQRRYLTSHSFRLAASRALTHVLSQVESSNWVIALPPSGLMGSYWKVVKKTQDATIVVLRDAPENILKRITFYDIDSCRIQKTLTERERGLYLRKIKGDITYFNRFFQKAHMSVDITGCNPEEASHRVGNELAMALSREQRQEQEHTLRNAR